MYFYTEMQESHIWGNLTERDAVIFYNNDFEIFIKPNEVQPTYAEFEINALGTLWDLLLVRPYRRNGPVFNEWDINDTQIGIHYNGTLNDPSDVDESWSIEIAIPIDPIRSIDRGSEIRHGSYWRINFSRVQWQHDVKDGIYDRKRIQQEIIYLKITGYGLNNLPLLCIGLSIGDIYILIHIKIERSIK